MHGRVCWSVLSRLWGQQIWDKFSKCIMGLRTNCQSSYRLFLKSKMRANQFKIATSLNIRPSKQVENQFYQGRNGLFSITEELLTGRRPRSKTRKVFPTREPLRDDQRLSETISSMVLKCFDHFWLASLFLSLKDRREIHHFAWLQKAHNIQVCGRVSCWRAEIQPVSEAVLDVVVPPSWRKGCWGCASTHNYKILTLCLVYDQNTMKGEDRCACWGKSVCSS